MMLTRRWKNSARVNHGWMDGRSPILRVTTNHWLTSGAPQNNDVVMSRYHIKVIVYCHTIYVHI
jgi:hypothetical protein